MNIVDASSTTNHEVRRTPAVLHSPVCINNLSKFEPKSETLCTGTQNLKKSISLRGCESCSRILVALLDGLTTLSKKPFNHSQYCKRKPKSKYSANAHWLIAQSTASPSSKSSPHHLKYSAFVQRYAAASKQATGSARYRPHDSICTSRSR